MANLNRRPPGSSTTQLRVPQGDINEGTIQISDDVIAAVVRKYTLSVPGVARLVGQSLVGGLATIIGKKVSDRAIRVDMDGDLVNITVNVIVRFGEHVPTVATHIQAVCRKYVEQLTGQRVGRVNVVVQNLESEEDQELPVTDDDDMDSDDVAEPSGRAES